MSPPAPHCLRGCPFILHIDVPWGSLPSTLLGLLCTLPLNFINPSNFYYCSLLTAKSRYFLSSTFYIRVPAGHFHLAIPRGLQTEFIIVHNRHSFAFAVRNRRKKGGVEEGCGGRSLGSLLSSRGSVHAERTREVGLRCPALLDGTCHC